MCTIRETESGNKGRVASCINKRRIKGDYCKIFHFAIVPLFFCALFSHRRCDDTVLLLNGRQFRRAMWAPGGIYGYFTFAKWAHFCCRCRWRLLCSFAERHHFIYSLNNDEDDKGHDNKMNHGGKERTVIYVVVADQVELSLNLAGNRRARGERPAQGRRRT